MNMSSTIAFFVGVSILLGGIYISYLILQFIFKTKQTLFKLRLKKSTRQAFKSHEIKHLKHKLAQLLTIEHQNILKTIFSN